MQRVKISAGFFRGGEPNFAVVRRPGKPVFAWPFPGQHRLLASQIDDRDEAPIVVPNGVIHERDLVSAVRKTDVAHVSASGIKHLTDRELDVEFLANITRYCQARAVRSPVRV